MTVHDGPLHPTRTCKEPATLLTPGGLDGYLLHEPEKLSVTF